MRKHEPVFAANFRQCCFICLIIRQYGLQQLHCLDENLLAKTLQIRQKNEAGCGAAKEALLAQGDDNKPQAARFYG